MNRRATGSRLSLRLPGRARPMHPAARPAAPASAVPGPPAELRPLKQERRQLPALSRTRSVGPMFCPLRSGVPPGGLLRGVRLQPAGHFHRIKAPGCSYMRQIELGSVLKLDLRSPGVQFGCGSRYGSSVRPRQICVLKIERSALRKCQINYSKKRPFPRSIPNATWERARHFQHIA